MTAIMTECTICDYPNQKGASEKFSNMTLGFSIIGIGDPPYPDETHFVIKLVV